MSSSRAGASPVGAAGAAAGPWGNGRSSPPRSSVTRGQHANDVMKPERIGYQGRGPARTLRRRESYRERKARLAAQGRDLAGERRQQRRTNGSLVAPIR